MHLDWVDENGARKYNERNAATQKLIRRRATQAAVLTKHRQKDRTSHLKSQTQQLEPWIVHGSLPTSSSSRWTNVERLVVETGVSRCRKLSTTVSTTLLPTSPYSSLSTPEVLQRLLGVFQGQTPKHDIFDRLVSRFSVPDEQTRYFKTLALTDAEYLQAINTYYGRSVCLDAAIDCLTARINDVVTGTARHVSTLQLYTWALRTLRQSIASNPFRERFEIYYAIPLLVLFELLNPEDQLTYLTHGRGAVHLLHFIGPDGIETELDKTLLAMQSDLMVIENIRDGHKHCCAATEWQSALRRTIRDDLLPGTARSEANITLNIIATALPEAFNDVETTITKCGADVNQRLRNTLETTMVQFQSWQQRWGPILHAGSAEYQNALTPWVLLAVFWMYTAILHRLLAAAPGPPHQRLSLELKALAVANNALQIAADSQLHSSVSQTRLDIVAKFVRSVTETSSAWQKAVGRTLPDEPICRTLFMDWSARLGRRSVVQP